MKLANSELKLTAEKNVRKNILDIYLVYPSGDREYLMSIRSNPYVFKLLRGYVGIHELKESLKKMVSSLSIRKYYNIYRVIYVTLLIILLQLQKIISNLKTIQCSFL